jgi:hypothetical protein
MGRDEIRVVADNLLDELTAILSAFPHRHDLMALPLSDRPMRMESFGSEWTEDIWRSVRSLYIATRRARERDAEAYTELHNRMGEIERFVNAI